MKSIVNLNWLSQGKVLNSVVKGHEYEKSPDKVDVTPMVEQINNIKETL